MTRFLILNSFPTEFWIGVMAEKMLSVEEGTLRQTAARVLPGGTFGKEGSGAQGLPGQRLIPNTNPVEGRCRRAESKHASRSLSRSASRSVSNSASKSASKTASKSASRSGVEKCPEIRSKKYYLSLFWRGPPEIIFVFIFSQEHNVMEIDALGRSRKNQRDLPGFVFRFRSAVLLQFPPGYQ